MPSCGAFVLADFCFCSAVAYSSLSPAVSCCSIFSISGALRPPGMVAPNAGTNRNLRTKKMSAMDATLIKFSTADSCKAKKLKISDCKHADSTAFLSINCKFQLFFKIFHTAFQESLRCSLALRKEHNVICIPNAWYSSL